MKKITRSLLGLGIALSFLLVVPLITPSLVSPVHAATAKPTFKVGYTLKPRQFSVKVGNIKSVSYVIEYTRSAGSREQTEGLTGGGKAKNGSFTGVHFAGTQSSKYFIPHDVKRGVITVNGKDLAGKSFSYKSKFVISKGKMVLQK